MSHKHFWEGIWFQALVTALNLKFPDWAWWEVTAGQQFTVAAFAFVVMVVLHEGDKRFKEERR